MTRAPDVFPRDRGLGSIDYSQAPKALYYIADTGDRWRVHDCVVQQGKPVRIGLPDSDGATCRVFVAATGVKKLYLRKRGEIWRCTPAQLDRQLMASEFLATTAFQPAERTAR